MTRGRLVRVLRKTDFNWGASVASGTLIGDAFRVNNIYVGGYREVVALVRTHAFAGGALFLSVYAEAPTSEAPDLLFRDTASALIYFQPVPVNVTTAVGGLYRAACLNSGGWISIALSATQGVTGPLTATLSIDVSLKA